jgi:hypothetical protein
MGFNSELKGLSTRTTLLRGCCTYRVQQASAGQNVQFYDFLILFFNSNSVCVCDRHVARATLTHNAGTRNKTQKYDYLIFRDPCTIM